MPRDREMTPRQLRRHIKRLDPNTPRHTALEQALGEGVNGGKVWYETQQEHLLGWLREYSGPGAYGRKIHQGRDARFVYNHFQCVSALFWLAEALGLSDEPLDAAFEAVTAAPKKSASQCGAFRKVVPWDMIAEALNNRTQPNVISRIAARIGLIGYEKDETTV